MLIVNQAIKKHTANFRQLGILCLIMEVNRMDDFKKANMNQVDGMDYNCPRYCKRRKNDGNILRRLARKRLKQKLKKEIRDD